LDVDQCRYCFEMSADQMLVGRYTPKIIPFY